MTFLSHFNTQKDYKLPPIVSHSLLWAILLLLIPNIILFVVSLITHTARPIVNMDYLLVGVLLTVPNRWSKILGVLLLWLFSATDTANFVMQLFPFMDLQGFLYLAPFVLAGPTRYILFAISFVLYLLLLPVLILKLTTKTNLYHAVVVAVVTGVIGYFLFTSDVMYHHGRENSVGSENYYVIGSQTRLYTLNQNFDLFIAKGTKPTFSPTKYKRASDKLTQPYSHKILLIVNESWGYPQAKGAQEAIIAPILQQQSLLEKVSYGHSEAGASTVDGEIKELCGKDIKGYGLSLSPDSEFTSCLPNLLAKQGYQTVSYHGATGSLYDRTSWYPKAGLQQNFFAESLMQYKHCSAFHGVCDTEIFPLVADNFKGDDKKFVYWMTLTTHSPYDEQDLHTQRFDCQKYNINDNEVCRNLKLQAQFFDGLAQLNARPEMKGVEVIVVGDHLPPIIDGRARYNSYEYLSVGWLHYTIK